MMNKNILKSVLVLSVLLLLSGISANASTSDEVMNDYYFEMYGQNIGADFDTIYKTPETEATINPETASMMVNTVDYVIEGKNDLDIIFKRTFDSYGSTDGFYMEQEYNYKTGVLSGYTRKYINSETGYAENIVFKNEYEMYEAGESFTGDDDDKKNRYAFIKNPEGEVTYTLVPGSEIEKYYEEAYYYPHIYTTNFIRSFYEMGKGWHMNLPAFEEYDEISDGYDRTKYYIFMDRFCSSYKCEIDIDKEPSPDRFVSARADSKFNTVITFADASSVDATASHPSGFNYTIIITTENGDKYYFERTSNLKYDIRAIEDRFDNIILIDSTPERAIITDTYGITYICSQDGISKTVDGVTTELVKYTWETINTEKDVNNEFDIDNHYIFSVIKNSGTSNTISEDEPNKISYYMKQEYMYSGILRYNYWLIYNLPYKVVAPSGMTMNFDYEKFDIKIGVSPYDTNGYRYNVTEYYEQYGDYIKNMIDCETTTKYQTGYGIEYLYAFSKKYMNDSQIVKTHYTEMNFDGKKVLEKISSGSSYESSYESKEYSYHLDYISQITHTSRKTYSGNILEQFSYSSGKLTRQSKGDIEYNYTYYADNYYIPHTTTYKKDANTTVKTENILTEDGKSIATQNVYENDILKSTVHFTYDSYGNVVSKTIPIDDTNSAVTTYAYTYNADGGYTITATQTGITDADGNALEDIVTTVTYDSQNNIISQTDANGNTTTMTYDLLNRPLTISYPDGTSESYEYDMANNVTTYTGKDGEIKKAYFDKWGNKSRICAISDGEELLLEKYKYDTFGNMNYYYRYYDNSNYTRVFYSYDYLSRPLREYIQKNGVDLLRDTIYSYSISSDSNSRPLYTTKATVSGDSGTYATQSRTTDYMGNITKKKIFTDEEERIYTYTYDYVGNMLSETNPAGQTVATTYDYLNRPVTVTDAAGSVKTFEYNALDLVSRESDFMGNFATYTYDNAGRLITKISPFDADDNAVSHMYYDANGNVIQTKTKSNISGNADEYQTADSAYDSMNRLSYTAVHPTSGTSIYTQYEYTALGLPERVVYGLTSLIEPGADVPDEASSVSYEYDDLGRLKKLYDGLGEDETYTYDYQGRLRVKLDKMSRLTTYTYDDFDNLTNTTSGTESISHTYNILGQRTSMTDSTGTTTYTYNPFGELTTEAKGDIIKSYSYDNISNRTAFDIMNNDSQIMSLAYAYDSLNRLISVSDGTDTASYTYDANSNELTASLNGEVYKSTQYNLANLPTRVNFPNTGDDTNRIEYTYRVNGNMHSHRDWLDYTAARIYNYDGAGRLIMDLSALEDDNYTDRFTYDTRGNIISVEHTDRSVSPNVKTTTTYTYDRANRLLSSTDGTNTTAYTYDGIGNMTSVAKNGEQIKSYSYDNFNRLSSSTVNGVSTSYTYDGDNLRQTKTTDGVTTQHILDGMNVVADIQGADTTTFTRGNGLVFSKNNGVRTTYNNYSNGGTAQLVKPDGTFTEYTYTAYGEIKYNSTDNTSPFTYCGEYTDVETGLVYLRNRYYDPELGRFLTQDPAMDGFNWYVYCAGDPVNFVDPWGVWGEDVHYTKTLNVMTVQGEIYTPEYREIIARACRDTDRYGLSPMPWGDQSYHFNFNKNGGDSRIDHSEENLNYAIRVWNESEEIYERDLTEANKIQDPELRDFAIQTATTARENRRYLALETLGQGLHALQDIDAHMQIFSGQILTLKVHEDGNGNPETIDDTQYDMYLDNDGKYYPTESKGAYNSNRYKNTERVSIEYLKRFKEGISK